MTSLRKSRVAFASTGYSGALPARRVAMTVTAESRKMVAILQLIVERPSLTLDIHVMAN